MPEEFSANLNLVEVFRFLLRKMVIGVVLGGFAFFAVAREAGAVDLPAFFEQHCVKCHGKEKQKGEVTFHGLTAVTSETMDLWKQVVDQLEFGEMPPEDEPQPSGQETESVLSGIRKGMRSLGYTGDSDKLHLPEYGNYVDHKLLFGGEIKTPPFSPTRLWRLSPEIFQAEYGTKTQSPFVYTTSGDGFRDFAVTSVADQGTIEMLVNHVSTLFEREFEMNLKAKRPHPRWVLRPFLDGREATEEQMKRLVGQRFQLATGRVPTESEIGKHLAFLKQCLETGGVREGLKTALLAIHLSPEAIYRLELGLGETDQHGRKRLSDEELAFALAYALTDKGPMSNPAIKEALVSGELKTNDGVAKLLRRLLYEPDPFDPKVNPRIIRFFAEYFGYRKVAFVFKDNEKQRREIGFPINEQGIRMMIEDLENLIRLIVAEDHDVLQRLLTTDHFLIGHNGDNPSAREKYEKYLDPVNLPANENAKKPRLQRMNFALERGINPFPGNTAILNYIQAWGLPHEGKSGQLWSWEIEQPFQISNRRGILTHPAWLWAHSTNFDNDPIHRGKWIREKLLAGVIQDVPPDVDAQIPEDPHKTLRERLDVIRAEECWRCHRKMNPLGEPFEIFDDFGRYRPEEFFDEEGKLFVQRDENFVTKRKNGTMTSRPVDASGAIRGSDDPEIDGPVKDALEMIDRLAKSERVRQSFVRHVFRYFLGRNEMLSDSQTLIEADQAYVESDGSFRELVVSLLSSDSFLYRR